MKEQIKVYISGPIAGYDLKERKRAFQKVKEKLYKRGYIPVNPFENGLPDDAHWREHMKADIAMLVKCDRIYMMTDWHLSKGCKLEFDVATSCGIDIM